MASRYSLYAVELNTTVISGVKNVSVNGQITSALEAHDGQVYPDYAVVLEQKPQITFSTTDITAAIAATGMSGTNITSCTLYWQARASGGARGAALSNLKAAATTGYVVLGSLAPSHNQVLEAELMVHLVSSNGILSPLTWADDQSLAGTLTTPDCYTLGPIHYTPNGGSLTDLKTKNWSFDVGVQLEVSSDDGLPFPDFVDVEEIRPVFTANSPRLNSIMDIPIEGVNCAVTAYLRKLSPNGARVAAATEEHISLTIADALGYTESQTGAQGSPADASLKLEVIDNLTDAPVVIDTTAAIPSV